MCSSWRYSLSTRLAVTLILVCGGIFFISFKMLDSNGKGSYVVLGDTSIWQGDGSSSNMYFHQRKRKEQGTVENVFGKRENICTEKKHVYYIKLHKTGSGTLSNIFLRFGLSRNMTFAIPQEGIFFPLEKLQVSDIKPSSKGKYDMLIHHSTFNPAIKSSVFPRDVQTIASFRQPFPLFVSTYYFFQLQKSIPKTMRTKGSAVLELEQYIDFVYNQTLKLPGTAGNLDMNKLSIRLGVPLSRTRHREYVEHFTETVLDKEIDFVTIQGFFDESLVLLKRKLCWQTKDILYRGLHFGSHTSTKFHEIADDVRSIFKELMSAEYIIFNHFQTKFLKEMLKEGSDFLDEVRDFKMILGVVKEFCDGNPVGDELKVMPRSVWSYQFEVTASDCEDMLLLDPMGLEKILEKKNVIDLK